MASPLRSTGSSQHKRNTTIQCDLSNTEEGWKRWWGDQSPFQDSTTWRFIGILLFFKCNPGAHCNRWECHTQDDYSNVCMLVHKKIAIIILSSIIHLFIQQNILLKKRREKHNFTKKKHIFFKEPHDIYFFWCIKISSSILTHKNLSPTLPPSHHLFFGSPNPGESSPKLGSISNSWSKRNNFRASHLAVFFGKSWRTSKGLQMGKMGPVQNKWSQNKWSVSLGVFLFHPTYVKVIKLFHRPLYNWRPILWHFDVGKLLESWDPRGTKFLK